MESSNCTVDVAASDSADVLENHDSAGLEIFGDSLQRHLVERDGILELLGQQQVSDKGCEREVLKSKPHSI